MLELRKKAGATNPKIKSLLDEIMNDSSTNKSLSTIPQAIPKKPELIIDEIILPLVKSKPRTKGEIVGFSDGDDNSDDSESDESIDISDIKPKVKFLPSTIEGFCERFRTIWSEFTRQGKHEHRNEIVVILDELLRQEAITRDDYCKLNNILAETLVSRIAGSGKTAAESPQEEAMEVEIPEYEEAESSKDEAMDPDNNDETTSLKQLIHSTFEYLIQPDKKELMELIKEFQQDADAVDTAQELEELIDAYILDEFIDEESIYNKI